MSLKKWKGTALGSVAAPFTGGLSLAGGFLYDSINQQNEANKKAIDRANAYDMYTWDLANQYNDPKAQMVRLEKAGLNKNLVYGSGNVTGNTSGVAGSNGVASQTGIAGGMLEKGLPLAQGLANLRNTNSQNELLKYQMDKTDADRKWTEAQTTNLWNYLSGKGNTTYSKGNWITDAFDALFGKDAGGDTKGSGKGVSERGGNAVGSFVGKHLDRLQYLGPGFKLLYWLANH